MKQFKLPDVGEGLTEAEIVSWKVKPGDTVKVNEIVVEIETAKSLVELPSPFAGVVAELLVAEGTTVAGAQGIVLDADPEALIDHAAKPEVAYNHKASMLQDIEARRTTEIDYLNGGIARFGAELGVPSPLNDTIAALIRGIETSWETS